MDEALSVLVQHPVRLFVFDDGRRCGIVWGVVQAEVALVTVDGVRQFAIVHTDVESSFVILFIYLYPFMS